MARLHNNLPFKHLTIFIAVSLIVGVGLLHYLTAYGANRFTSREVKLSSSRINDTARYAFSFSGLTSAPLGSIRFDFCRNSPLVEDPCDPPIDFSASAATLISQSGETGFTIDAANSTANTIVLTRTASLAISTSAAYEFANIHNSTQIGSSFVRVQTYASQDATGSAVDFGGLAYALTNSVNINVTVPPFLLFCLGITISGTDCSTASGDYVNFGELSSKTTRTASTQMVVATNGAGGYSLSVNGTTMLSGTNSIPSLGVTDVSRPGTSQFGINLRANSDPSVGANPLGPGGGTASSPYNIVNRYHFASGDQVAGSPNPEDYRKYTVSYIVNINKDQAPGIYVSTLTYVCIATF